MLKCSGSPISEVYEGYWKENRAEGQGRFVHTDGDVYWSWGHVLQSAAFERSNFCSHLLDLAGLVDFMILLLRSYSNGFRKVYGHVGDIVPSYSLRLAFPTQRVFFVLSPVEVSVTKILKAFA